MTPGGAWQRLDPRIIWVDGVYAALAFVPTGLALLVADEPHPATLIPALVVALGGVLGAVRDTLRWLKTRYRLTEDLVEIRTGLLVRKYRSLRRERIRSVSTTARLRHRLAGLRVLTVGVGQPGAAGYEALHLDAVSRTAAAELRHELLNGSPELTGAQSDLTTAQPGAAGQPGAPGTSVAVATADTDPDGVQLFARIRWSWLLYNVFSIWSLVTAAGLIWGGYWLAQSFGLDPAGVVTGLLDWRALGTGRSVVIGFLLVGALGVLGMAVAFVAENWAFRLVRVGTADGGVLRTSQGLFRTREVNRDVRRLRGVEISEPLLWRWMGMADTNVISTGLTIWSMTPATTILPRGPIGVARTVAARVLDLGGEPSPFTAPLPRHPGAAFRRRLGWALLATAVVTGVLAWLGGTFDTVSSRIWLAGVALLPLMLGAAGVAYRALGHGIVGDYLVVRSGLVSRSTSALHRSAVIGWCLRQSVLQRRLGLATVVATTAAGHGQYAAVDVSARTAAAFAERAVPGLLTPLMDTPATAPPEPSGLPDDPAVPSVEEACRRIA